MGQKNERQKKQSSLFSIWRLFGGLNFCLIIVSIIFVAALYFQHFAASSLGRIAGFFMGSYEGVTEGLGKGGRDGEEAGLSAEDTKVHIENEIKKTGKLQVFTSELKLTDVYKQGDNYAALISAKGVVVFTVDLTEVNVIQPEKKQIIIEIPRPEHEITISDEESKIEDEYNPNSIKVNLERLFEKTENGYTGYLNSRQKILEEAEEEIQNSSYIMELAEEAAVKQVDQLVGLLSEESSVSVRFAD